VDGLETAIEMLERVREAVGLAAASRETLVEALGYKSINGASARKVAVLSHFGLLDRVGKGTSKVSELGRRILMPVSDNDKIQAIANAARKPTLFSQLFDRLNGHALPSLLPNLLVREFGVFHGSAESVADTFRASMEYAGLLSNGVLSEEIRPALESANTPDSKESGARQPHNEPLSDGLESTKAELQRYTIALDGAGRVARIEIPLPVTATDLRRVERWAQYMGEIVAEPSN
jgi:hypothetical protein